MTVAAEHGYVPLNEHAHSGHAKLLALVGSGKRVLDVGCSSGYLARPLVARGCTVVGLELDPTAAALARDVCEDVLVGDVETMELPFEPGSFDVVLCGDLIEHLRDPEAFLARVRPFLRADGRVVLSTPNVANWAMRLGLLAGRWRYTERGILDRTHTHLFTRSTLVETLERAGYRVVELDFTVPLPVARTPATERVAHAVGRLRPPLFAYQFVVAADACVISVVIPVKDGGADLVRCLDAIGRQVVESEVEVVVVDSGSRDGSAELARSRGARVHEIPASEFGHGRTRNLGAELAQGEILVFTSQDAFAADETWLATLVRSLSGDRARSPARTAASFRTTTPLRPSATSSTSSTGRRRADSGSRATSPTSSRRCSRTSTRPFRARSGASSRSRTT